MPHLSLDVATMVLEGELPPRVLVRILYDHIKELCPECREALETVQGMPVRHPHHHRQPAAVRREQYDAAMGSVGEKLRAAEAERRRARRDLAELRALAPAERERRIAAARTRFRSRALGELLIEASRETVRRDPAEAAALAALVPRVISRLAAADAAAAAPLAARALAHRANALRVGGDLPAAGRLFGEVRERLAATALDDPALHAEVCSLEASLRVDQRRLDDAEELLDRSILLSRLGHDDHALAKALIQRADVLGAKGEEAQAAASLRESLTLLDETADRHLFACAIGTLTLLECERGEHAAAAALLERHRPLLVDDGGAWSLVRVLALEGRVAHGLGRTAEAEERLLAALRLCAAEGMEVDAANLSLDLAVLYVEQGRMREVREIATRVQMAFAAREVHREATAALLLFQQAVAAERLTAEAMRRIRDAVCRRAGNAAAAAAPDVRPS